MVVESRSVRSALTVSSVVTSIPRSSSEHANNSKQTAGMTSCFHVLCINERTCSDQNGTEWIVTALDAVAIVMPRLHRGHMSPVNMYPGRATCIRIHMSDEPGELSKSLSHDDSTINIVIRIIIIIIIIIICRRTHVAGYKLLFRDTCRLYLGDIITIHLCHGRLVSLCIQQQTGDKLATILFSIHDRCRRRQVDTTCIRQHVSWCKRGITSCAVLWCRARVRIGIISPPLCLHNESRVINEERLAVETQL